VAKQQRAGLGRGLSALFTDTSEMTAVQQQQREQATIPVQNSEDAVIPQVAIDSIIPNPNQPRKPFDKNDQRLLELSESIKEHGLLQPIIVTPLSNEVREKSADSWFSDGPSKDQADGGPKYQIIAGERRWWASQKAGLKMVPVVIKDVTPQQMLELALIENIQRADLNPIEEALAYQALIQEFHLTQDDVAKRVGRDRTTITNALRLLKLAPQVRDILMKQPETFTEGHARAIASLQREEEQIEAMSAAISNNLSVRQTEELVKRMKKERMSAHEAASRVKAKPIRSEEVKIWETDFRHALMAKVDLKCDADYKGTLVVHFNDQDELEGLYNRLVKNEE
jgi:ParB family chromosome partitioning protein